MTAGDFGGSVVVATIVLFVAAVAHHVGATRRNTGPEARVSDIRGLRRSPRASAFGIAAFDLGVVAVLVVAPRIGLLVAAVVLTSYAFALARRPSRESCGCFGTALETTNRAGAIRDVGLAFLAALAGVLALRGHAPTLSQGAIGLALVILAVIVGGGYATRISGDRTLESEENAHALE